MIKHIQTIRRFEVLCPAGSIVRVSHHRKSPTKRKFEHAQNLS